MEVFFGLNHLPKLQNTVVTIGSFDGVHLGHRQILSRLSALARSCGGKSVVITFDPHPRAVLRPDDPSFKLITTTSEKIGLLQGLDIDYVVVMPFTLEFSNQDAASYVEDFLLKHFNPRYIVIGYDHHFGKNREGNIEFLKKYTTSAGFDLLEIPAQEVDEIAVSSSKIRKALENCEISRANRLLGHPFTFSGEVVKGRQIGRTIGFPTANVLIEDPYKLILPQGIYAAYTLVNGARYKAMLYIGNRPSVEENGLQTIEVNILDFDGSLYGETLTVEVIDFIRGDKKLDSLDALKAQIETDKISIVKALSHPAHTQYPQPQSISNKPSELKTAIVILNYNTRKHLEEFLPSVVKYSQGASIIVADNGSPDDSIDFLRKNYPTIEVIDLKQNFGFAQGYNEALKQVTADIYVVLNSDVAVTENWLEPILTAMQNDPLMAIAQPKIRSYSEKNRFEYAGAAGGYMDVLGYPFCRGRIFGHQEVDLGQYDQATECFWAAGAAFFIRAELYHAFGGFDGDYFAHNEEIDLCWRLKRAGYSVWCIPTSTVYHLGGGTLEYENPRKIFLNFRNSLYTLLKNETTFNLFWKIPARMLLDGVAGAMFATKGKWKSVTAIVRAHFSFYGTFLNTLEKRRNFAKTLDKLRAAPANQTGILAASIVWKHYLTRVKEYSKL